MNEDIDTIDILPEEYKGRDIVITNQSGSVVTVNVNNRNTYSYAYPEWFDKEFFIELVRGGGK